MAHNRQFGTREQRVEEGNRYDFDLNTSQIRLPILLIQLHDTHFNLCIAHL